eukprot:1152958-Pelagomonas_calceolata.AAC.1
MHALLTAAELGGCALEWEEVGACQLARAGPLTSKEIGWGGVEVGWQSSGCAAETWGDEGEGGEGDEACSVDRGV